MLLSFDVENIEDISDGYHTFKDLYHQRLILTAALFNQIPHQCGKSYRHDDGELCFDGTWFIVWVNTPEGVYSYHYENKYWDLFDVLEYENGPEWDGHTSKDVTRLLSLKRI